MKVPTDSTNTITSTPSATESISKTFLGSNTKTSLEATDLYANLFDPNDE